jgi:hypothetical protein
VSALSFFFFDFYYVLAIALSQSRTKHLLCKQSITKPKGDKNQATYNLFAAYVHTVPVVKLIDSLERSRRDGQLRHVVIHGAARSYCLSRAERLIGSYLRTFALELKEQLAQTFAPSVTSILTRSRGRLDVEGAEEPPLRLIIEVLQQVMCIHDAEKLAISVSKIYDDGYRQERTSK